MIGPKRSSNLTAKKISISTSFIVHFETLEASSNQQNHLPGFGWHPHLAFQFMICHSKYIYIYNLYFVHLFFVKAAIFVFFSFVGVLFVREQRVNFPDTWRLERQWLETPKGVWSQLFFWDGLVTPSFDWRWWKWPWMVGWSSDLLP